MRKDGICSLQKLKMKKMQYDTISEYKNVAMATVSSPWALSKKCCMWVHATKLCVWYRERRGILIMIHKKTCCKNNLLYKDVGGFEQLLKLLTKQMSEKISL